MEAQMCWCIWQLEVTTSWSGPACVWSEGFKGLADPLGILSGSVWTESGGGTWFSTNLLEVRGPPQKGWLSAFHTIKVCY